MQRSIVVSADQTFLETLRQLYRDHPEEAMPIEAPSPAEALAVLDRGNIRLVLVDETIPEAAREDFFRTNTAAFPGTWFVFTGQTRCPGVLHLDTPIEWEPLSFFLGNRPLPDLEENSGDWMRHYMEQAYPILLHHLWTGILNGWVRSDRTLILMAGRRIAVPYLEDMQLLPVLVKTVHQSKVAESHSNASRDHLFFSTLLTRHLLTAPDGGAALDRYSQKWAVLAYMDVYPCSPEEMEQRCLGAAAEAEAMNWQLRFYIGTPVTPEDLQEQWNALEALSAGDVGFQPGVVHMGAQIPRDAPPLPDMQLLGALLEQGRFREAGARIDEYVLPLARSDRIGTGWLMHLRDELLQAIYTALQFHGIPAELVLTEQRMGEDFQRSATTVLLLLAWVRAILERMEEFLESEQADTPVKRARKYILQNLDQELSREDIAAHVFVSSGYLGRLFKRETGMSLSEYIFQERMKLAARLLSQTSLYVTAVAMRVGFSNFPYFSTQFKKYSGMTPVEYRRRAGER
ncbi:MAG: helix-turn-helix transcriptional regulator [Oscillospiraceae bacterium]|nr:helix-turn-helix transcriptional regulator [Oscillospiraceae bacterium]